MKTELCKSASDYWDLNGTPTNPSLWGPDGVVIHIHPPGGIIKHWSFRVGMPNGCDFVAKADLQPRAWSEIRERIKKSELAKYLGINKSNITRWKDVPAKHRDKVAEYLGELRS